MKKVIAVTSTLVATSVVSVNAAMASPMHTTVSGPPAAWSFGQTRTVAVPAKSGIQPVANTQNSKPQDARDKGEVKSIEAQVPAPVAPAANQCTGDARFSNPPVVNNPHHLRNVIWRNMRATCAQ